ncbi:MAG: 30S ribosomal protein S3 [Bacteroides sp.]|nr:MAG: 30S ribosomal protein S3 [Bacteroides sp.]
MGQKTNPIGNRLGIIRGWDSNWYGEKDYIFKIIEDNKIRNYINARIPKASISKIIVERTLKRITITIYTSRPGIIIGKGGQEVDKIKNELKKITKKKDLQINILEIKKPSLDAKIVSENIAKQLESRLSFKKVIKSAIMATMRIGAEGIKIVVSGRLGGAEMARRESYREGSIPLNTFRSDIDYACNEAYTSYGKIGVKVWICNGNVYGKRDLSKNFSKDKKSVPDIGYKGLYYQYKNVSK